MTPTTVYAWNGTHANEDEISVATSIATVLASDYNGSGGRTVVNIAEGSETGEFWSALGGQAEYANVSPGQQAPRDARLFQASTATGSFKVEEVSLFVFMTFNENCLKIINKSLNLSIIYWKFSMIFINFIFLNQ